MIEHFITLLMNDELKFSCVSIAIATIPTIVYLRASGEEITALGLWGAIWNKVLR